VWLAAVPLGWVAVSLLDDDQHNALYSTLFGLLLPIPFLLLILVIPRHARVGRAIVLGLSFYFGAGFVVGPIIVVFVTWPSIFLLPAAAGYFVVPLVSRYRRLRAFDKQFTAEFRRLNYFGAPAPAQVHAAGDQQPFDPGRRMLAVRLADHLLRTYLVRIPALRIFHQIATPGSRLPIVDHAILCGRRLVLIDSVI
jgi:MFS family permease